MSHNPLKMVRRTFSRSHHKNRLLTIILLSSCIFIFCLLTYQTYSYLTVASVDQTPPVSADTEFEEFTRRLFTSEISTNTLTLHYTLQNPSAYGISQSNISFGNYVPGSAGSSSAKLNELLNQLHEFPYEMLNSENQLTYDIMEYQLTAQIDAAPYALYEEVFSPTLGTQAQLPILLAEYSFESLDDVDTYLELLSQLGPYFESLLQFEREKSEAGLFMWADTANTVLEQCQAFIENPEENFLLDTFEGRIENLPFSSLRQKEAYIQSNRNCIFNSVIPAYKRLIAGLTELKATGKNPMGLSYFNQGKKYYETLIASTIGSGHSISEIQDLIEERMDIDLEIITDTISENPQLVKEAAMSSQISENNSVSIQPDSTTAPFIETPTLILEKLKQKMEPDFPSVAVEEYQVKTVHPSLEKYLSPAFYLSPPIDAANHHTIYINGAADYDSLSLFTTLAHEGYPGHLYQTLYESASDPDPVRSLFYFGGFVEGWATYAERCSYSYTDLDPDLSALLAANNSLSLGIYAQIDVGVHYYGWTLEQTAEFLSHYGVQSKNTAQNIYQAVLENPANYLKYYLGYVEIEKLKEQAQAALKENFQLKDFHAYILSIGPAPFPVLEKYLQKWISNVGSNRTEILR